LFGIPARVVSFIPQPIPGKAENPPYNGQPCFGLQFETEPSHPDSLFLLGLTLLQNYYQEHTTWQRSHPGSQPSQFFLPFFRNLSGTPILRQQLEQNLTPQQILRSWLPQLAQFKALRSQHLLYPAENI
jgi:hypothetical protein